MTADPTLIAELRANFLTGEMSDQQLAEMAAAGDEVTIAPDTEPFHEGEPADYLWILLHGELELSRMSGGERTVLATMSTPGQWAGGLRAFGDASSSAGYRATGRALVESRMFRLSSEELGRLMGAWFPFGKHLVSGVFQTIRSIEATVRQRESLVALGTLAAGLAHEINNPAAASLRAVDALGVTCDEMLASLVELAREEIAASQFVELDALRRELAARPDARQNTVGMMDREETIGEWLEDRSVEGAWQLAAALGPSGADESWLGDVETCVGTAALGAALHWASSTVNATRLLAELTDATGRISHLVDTVRSYSQMDRASLQRVDVHDGIDSTLGMLAAKLGDVHVVKAYGADVPQFDAYAAELNQVWANLIDNAIDAMDRAGKLTITTSHDDTHVIVEISDTGAGMPPEVIDRAFEPFFTTKDVGKGTGLGLDISRRIVVQRHGGDITFQSSPGATTARVVLPLRR
jgi:signal transduction histidine kinase